MRTPGDYHRREEEPTLELAIAIAVAVVAAVAVAAALIASAHRVDPSERLVVFRFGKIRADAVRGPGLVFLIPIVEHGVRVELGERHVRIPAATMTAAGDATVDAGCTVGWRVVDPPRYVLNISEADGAVMGIAAKVLRETLSVSSLADIAARIDIELRIRSGLEATLQRWGATVTSIDLTDVRVRTSPPAAELPS